LFRHKLTETRWHEIQIPVKSLAKGVDAISNPRQKSWKKVDKNYGKTSRVLRGVVALVSKNGVKSLGKIID
jgi:hypothetical protein